MLTAAIEKLQAAVAAYEKTLAEPGLYARDVKKFMAATNALAEARAALENAEERWLELEVLREAG